MLTDGWTSRIRLMMTLTDQPRYAEAILFTRGILGLLFFMAGWYKVFDLGAVQHAEHFFIAGYRDTWIPLWLLWGLGTVVPYLELAAGGLLLVGWRVREVLWILAGILLMVTYGHLLKEPLFDITSHIFPRSVFLIALLIMPRAADRWSVDAWLHRRAARKRISAP